MNQFRCRLLVVASICLTLITGATGQAASAAAASSAVAGAAGDVTSVTGSPVVALIMQLARGARDALSLFRRLIKAGSRLYEAVSPEFEIMRCMRKAVFTPVTPPFLKPPWPTDGWAALTRRRMKRSLGGSWHGDPLPPDRPYLLINGPLAPASPPQLRDLLEDFLSDAFGDPTIIEAWRDLRSSWFGVVTGRSTKCFGKYFKKRFWRWVDRG